MLHDRGFDDDATKEVAEHPLGSPFRAIHGDDRKTIWPDLGNAILKNSVGFSDVALLLSALGSTTMTNGDHSGASHGLGGSEEFSPVQCQNGPVSSLLLSLGAYHEYEYRFAEYEYEIRVALVVYS
ncbi:MAG: hypothetical protein R3C09_28860, partial [Pirellulaceae bacterium]